MLQKVEMYGLDLPRLYIASTKADVDIALEKGLPFIKWRGSMESLIKCLVRPALEKMYPYIKWNIVLGQKKKFNTVVYNVNGSDREIDPSLYLNKTDEDGDTEVSSKTSSEHRESEIADIADDYRSFANIEGTSGDYSNSMLKLEDYVGDMSSNVNLEVLQKLNLMPAFIGDIVDCIKVNLSNQMKWTEGYNKKLGVPLGRFSGCNELPNLIILDISGSIPRGISATMITLIDTMRSQLNADLIITASYTRFYSRHSELPDPQKIRNMFGYANESIGFFNILNQHVFGREWGHVISFGDNDQPGSMKGMFVDIGAEQLKVCNTIVHAVHHYHTTMMHQKTGYAKWCHEVMVGKDLEEHYDTSWCNVMER